MRLPHAALVLGAFHALFYAVFVPRWLARRSRRWHGWRAAGRTRGAAGGHPAKPLAAELPGAPAAQELSAARASRLPLLFHALAMGALYHGLTAATVGGPARCPAALGAAAGGVVMLGAAALAAGALAVFRSWRLQARIEPVHELCTAGPFRIVRHPIYLAMDLLALGSWLWAPTAGVALGAVLVALAGDLRARSEERLLLAVFGSSYGRYCRRSRRFLPGIY